MNNVGQVATSVNDAASYGYLYQWGRGSDGHQLRTAGSVGETSYSNLPGHGNFIATVWYGWLVVADDNLWQGINGVNNPCPCGYRLPTEAEFNAERLSWSSNDAAGAFASPLKLPASGYRFEEDGVIYNEGNSGFYWTSSVNSDESVYLFFRNFDAMFTNRRSGGFSVRCIKE